MRESQEELFAGSNQATCLFLLLLYGKYFLSCKGSISVRLTVLVITFLFICLLYNEHFILCTILLKISPVRKFQIKLL